MRTSPTCTHDPPDLIPSAWVINYWLIDANTPVLSPLITTNVGVLKPRIGTTKLEVNATIEAADTFFSTTDAMVIMDPCEPEALMRFATSFSLNELSTKADTLIDKASSLNFVSKEFVISNVFYKDCKTDPKPATRISTANAFCLSVFTIDGHESTDLQYRVLPHFKSPDIILGLPALK